MPQIDPSENSTWTKGPSSVHGGLGDGSVCDRTSDFRARCLGRSLCRLPHECPNLIVESHFCNPHASHRHIGSARLCCGGQAWRGAGLAETPPMVVTMIERAIRELGDSLTERRVRSQLHQLRLTIERDASTTDLQYGWVPARLPAPRRNPPVVTASATPSAQLSEQTVCK